MGKIVQAIRDRDNQALAAQVQVLTTMTAREVLLEVQKLCTNHNETADRALIRQQTEGGRAERWLSKDKNPRFLHLHLMEREHDVLISYSVTPQRILQKGFNAADRGWLASLSAFERSADDGSVEHAASMSLSHWSVNDSGYIWHGDKYKQLRDRLFENVGTPSDENPTRVTSWREVTIGGTTYRSLEALQSARTAGSISASDYRKSRAKLKGDDPGMRFIG